MAAKRPSSIKTLSDLKSVARQLAKQREREAAEAAAQKKQQSDQNLFARAIGATQPLAKRKAAVALAPEPPAPIAVYRVSGQSSHLGIGL